MNILRKLSDFFFGPPNPPRPRPRPRRRATTVCPVATREDGHRLEVQYLSLRQPWAWLVLHGHKDVENRGRISHFRGELFIHASTNRNYLSEDLQVVEEKYGIKVPEADLEFGSIQGSVMMVGCVKEHGSRWFEGPFGYLLEKPCLIKPIPLKANACMQKARDVEIRYRNSLMTPMRNLSKSKIIAYRQCPKRLWLEIHRPELRDDSASKMVFQIGHQVGDAARSLYDPEGRGVLVDIDALGHGEALARSAVLLRDGQTPVFEAGMAAGGALAYADVMLPDISDGTLRWKMIEVKSSTGVKDYHRDDIAVQTFIATSAGVRLSSVSLAHVDSTFVYQGDYQGLLQEVDLTDEAFSRSDEVKEWITGARTVASLPDEPEVATGPHCNDPFTCGFCAYCNRDKVWPEYPLSSLPRFGSSKQALMEELGIEDLRDVPDRHLSALQALVKKHTTDGTVFFDAEGAAADLVPHGFPAYFLDFETAMFAVPIWKGTRPYQQIPFQFSLHILDEDGALQHHGFLDLSGDDPSMACAQSLIDLCGDQGPVFAYNAGFECRVMRELAGRFPELSASLEAIVDRVVDLLPIARNRYYHPSQHGSWSIKAVLPAAVPELSYDQLDGVKDGTMAVAAFMEAVAPATPHARKREIETQLVSYCQLDTLAMVRLYQFFSGWNDKPPSHAP